MDEDDVKTRIETLERELRELRSIIEGAFSPLVQANGHPSHNPLFQSLRDLKNLKMDVKQFGYRMAEAAALALPLRTGLAPGRMELKSKPSTQADLASDWAAYWCGELKIPIVFHRKLWEFVYLLQALHEKGCIRPGARGLGFGCGEEPVPSYFASKGVTVTVTDLAPQEVKAAGWVETEQHAGSIDHVFKNHLVDRETFDRHVSLRYVNMNAIPSDLIGYDFCWSICALEHLGSIANGLDFIENSLGTLKPGGVAVHTTEFNFLNDDDTIDNWVTVLFQRRHFQALAERLRAAGHIVADLDFNVGDEPLDLFVDVPPYYDDRLGPNRNWLGKPTHLKLDVDGFAATCFGLIVTKAT